MPTTNSQTSSAFQPAATTGYVVPVTVTATAQTLGQLLATATAAIPVITLPGSGIQSTRFPRHVIFQSTGGNADSIYLTWDGQTNPVSTPNPVIGWEMTPGGYTKFENCYALLENGEGIHAANSTAFRFVADGDTLMCVIWSD